MKQCLEVGCWADSVNVRNHDLPPFSQLSINVIRQSHVMGDQTTRPSTAEYQKPAKGVSSLLFSSFVHTLAFLFRQN